MTRPLNTPPMLSVKPSTAERAMLGWLVIPRNRLSGVGSIFASGPPASHLGSTQALCPERFWASCWKSWIKNRPTRKSSSPTTTRATRYCRTSRKRVLRSCLDSLFEIGRNVAAMASESSTYTSTIRNCHRATSPSRVVMIPRATIRTRFVTLPPYGCFGLGQQGIQVLGDRLDLVHDLLDAHDLFIRSAFLVAGLLAQVLDQILGLIAQAAGVVAPFRRFQLHSRGLEDKVVEDQLDDGSHRDCHERSGNAEQ